MAELMEDPRASDQGRRSTPGEVVPQAVLRVSDLAISFEERRVLRGISLEVLRGETLAILGGSGCGKSTLLRSVIGALAPDRGSVELFGRDVYTADDETMGRLRKRFGVLFQSGALFNSMTVGDNIALILREHTSLDEEMIRIIVKMKLELVGLRDAEALMPSQLSGGMRKRVGLARALALDPELMLYDEPGAGLDPVVKAVVETLIMDLSRTLGVTSVVVTHHMDTAFRIADQMVMIHGGKVIAAGSPEDFRSARDPIVRQFVCGSPDGPLSSPRAGAGFKEDLLA
jgi:phospholipid/cholesterol/gamma-HCH transport system ATP-binding protein